MEIVRAIGCRENVTNYAKQLVKVIVTCERMCGRSIFLESFTRFYVLLFSVCYSSWYVYATHTYEHRLQYGESTCEVSGLPCQYDSDCSSGLCAGLYMLREEDVFDRTYSPIEELDKARLSRRLYPYCNSTAWSLQQYKDAVNNGNDYNLVGENIGEGTEGTYIPSFIKPTTPTISQEDKALLQRMWAN